MSHRVAVLPGDGIGPEITAPTLDLLGRFGDFEFTEHPFGGASIDAHGTALTDEVEAACRESDAVLLAAVGGPKWDTTDPNAPRPEQGLLGIRKELGLFANLRPVRPLPALYGASALKPEIIEGTNLLLGRGWSADRVLNDALVEGMRIVGIDFRDGILFVPEVLLAANAMKSGMAILRPLLAETGAKPVGKVVIGTVKGDIHDIGKNLVAMMLEGAGFEVYDLGINTDADKFMAALELHKPDILGMSALLTTTMPYMKVVIQTLKDRGIRDDYIVLVGGAPLNEEFGKAVGADAYCRDAAIAVETARSLVLERRARVA